MVCQTVSSTKRTNERVLFLGYTLLRKQSINTVLIIKIQGLRSSVKVRAFYYFSLFAQYFVVACYEARGYCYISRSESKTNVRSKSEYKENLIHFHIEQIIELPTSSDCLICLLNLAPLHMLYDIAYVLGIQLLCKMKTRSIANFKVI